MKILTIILFTALFCASCASGQKDSANDSEVMRLSSANSFFKVGKFFAVNLDSNPTTGYEWSATDYDKNIIELVDVKHTPTNTGRVGTGGVTELKFLAKASGKTGLKLIYSRQWEKDVKPIKEVAFNINVE